MQDGTSALMLARERGEYNMVELLLSHKADVNAQNKVTAVERGSKGYV